MGLAGRPQGMFSGPSGAAIAAAARIGWAMVSPFVFREPTGNLLDVRVEAPATVRKAALEYFDDWRAGRSMLFEQIGGPPYLDPLQAVCASRRTSAKVGVALGQWGREHGPRRPPSTRRG